MHVCKKELKTTFYPIISKFNYSYSKYSITLLANIF